MKLTPLKVKTEKELQDALSRGRVVNKYCPAFRETFSLNRRSRYPTANHALASLNVQKHYTFIICLIAELKTALQKSNCCLFPGLVQQYFRPKLTMLASSFTRMNFCLNFGLNPIFSNAITKLLRESPPKPTGCKQPCSGRGNTTHTTLS
jgi:hypothetical protein